MNTNGQNPPPRQDRAIVRTPAELDRISAITTADVMEARLRWQEVAPAGFGGLMEARLHRPKGTT